MFIAVKFQRVNFITNKISSVLREYGTCVSCWLIICINIEHVSEYFSHSFLK